MRSQHRQEDTIKVNTAMVERELTLFEMEQKLISAKSVELEHSALSERPETLDPIYMPGFICKLIHMMIDAKMFLKTEIDKAVISDPTVSVNDGVETDSATYNGLQSAFLTVRDDLGIDPVAAFENAKYYRFAAGPASTLSGDAPSPEIRLVELDHSALKRSVTFTLCKQPEPYFLKDRIHTFSRYAGQLARFRRRQIHRKITDYLTKFLLCDSGTAIIPVNCLHVSSLAPVKKCLTTLDPC